MSAIELKYNEKTHDNRIGDTVFFLYKNTIRCGEIEDILGDENDLSFIIDGMALPMSEVFADIDSLLWELKTAWDVREEGALS